MQLFSATEKIDSDLTYTEFNQKQSTTQMDSLLETIDEIKQSMPDASYMKLMDSLSKFNKQPMSDYKQNLLLVARYLTLQSFKYILDYTDGCDLTIHARCRDVDLQIKGFDGPVTVLLSKIICDDPRSNSDIHPHRKTLMYPNYILPCCWEAGAPLGGPMYATRYCHYIVTYGGIQTVTAEKMHTVQHYTELMFRISRENYDSECGCYTDMTAVQQFGDTVMRSFINNLIKFSTSSLTAWPYRQDLDPDDV
jgi:hypothetical protein